MKTTAAPAALPALLLLATLFVGPSLRPPAVGLLAVGFALSLALRGRIGLLSGSFFAGLLLLSLEPDRSLRTVALERPVEVVGEVRGEWRNEVGGASAEFDAQVVRQGGRIWTSPPPLRLHLTGGSTLPAPGSRLRLRGRLGRASGLANAWPTPPGPYRLSVKSSRLWQIETPPSTWSRALHRLRLAVSSVMDRAATLHPGVAYARGLLLGQLEDLPSEERLAFRRAGLAHLMAVSGMNVALVAGVAAALASFAGRWQRAAWVAFAVMLHLLVVGPVPSLVRATLMMGAAFFGELLERRTRGLQTLAIAAAAMAAVDPSVVFDLGFSLSCAATAGLLVVAPALVRGWPSSWRSVTVPLAVSWAAQATTLPWAVATFAYLPPLAPALNLLAVPLAGVLLVVALGWLLLAALAPALAEPLASLLDLLARPFGWLPAIPPGPWLCLPMPPSPIVGTLLAIAMVAAARSPRAGRRALLIALIATANPSDRWTAGGEAEWLVADVGQGDGSLVRQGRTAILIDGGGGLSSSRDFASLVWLPVLADRGLSRLDAVVVTHGDRDHCGGLVDVASYVRIGEVWAAEATRRSPCVETLLRVSRARLVSLKEGDRLSRGDLRFEILGPRADDEGSDNDRSLAFVLATEGRRVLFTGDIERRGERQLLARRPESLHCDLLKAAHHGSATSSGDRFLETAGAKWSIVSCGVANRFGHPAAEVATRLGRDSRLLRTDLQGAIRFRWRRGAPLRVALPGSPRAVSADPSE